MHDSIILRGGNSKEKRAAAETTSEAGQISHTHQ